MTRSVRSSFVSSRTNSRRMSDCDSPPMGVSSRKARAPDGAGTGHFAIATVLPVRTDWISANATASASRASAGVTTAGVALSLMQSRK